MSEDLPEIAYYYPHPYWLADEGDWIKNLLLFFDGVGILLPTYMYGRQRDSDPTLAGELEDRGLLHVYAPESFLDQQAAEELVDALATLISNGSFDLINGHPETEFQSLSFSRLGFTVDPELAQMIIDDLKVRGLASESTDGVSLPMHPIVRLATLVLLSQVAIGVGYRKGLYLRPTASSARFARSFSSFFSIPTMPSAGSIVSLDVDSIELDFSKVPLDDVLAFREENGADYRKYMKDVRSFVGQLSLTPEPERPILMRERAEELKDVAADLKRGVVRRWLRPGSKFTLGLVGGVWNLAQGDPLSALTSFGLGALDLSPDKKASAGAYSYLFRMQREFAPTA